MTVPTLHQQTGLSLILGNRLAGDKYITNERLTENINSYDHQIDAIGGFKTAAVSFNRNLANIPNYLKTTLGRRFFSFGQNNTPAFRGFVNQLNVSVAGLSYSIGPLMEVQNRVSATYTPVDYDVNPPSVGSQTTTLITEDLASQGVYGIIEGIVSASKCPEFWANQIRDVYLLERAEPKRPGDTISITPGGGGEATISLDILGMEAWLRAFIYSNPLQTSSIVSDKIKAVLTADPNNFISSDFTKIETNLFLANDYEEGNRFGYDVILELLSLGDDVTDRRMLFGIYEDDQAIYEEIPTEVEYIYRLSDQSRRIRNIAGQVIMPWDIRPGKYLFVPDFLSGSDATFPIANIKDPRVKFLESVRYSAPFTLDLSGGLNDTLSQLLAKITYTSGMM